jgi:hypothetical protein
LRPVFYSVEGDQAIKSGWINPKTCDVFTTLADDEMAVEVVPRAKPAFQTGERVEFADHVDLYPAEDILPRERGAVASWDIETGAVSIFLEGVHDGLEGNALVIRPFHDDWLLSVLRRFRDGVSSEHVKPPSSWSAFWALALGMLAAGAPWVLANAEDISHSVGTLAEFLY